MSRILVARISLGALFLCGCWMAYTQNRGGAPAQLTLNKVKDDLYEIEGSGGNVAVYITDEGVILVDDKYEQDYDNIMAKVKSVTNDPANVTGAQIVFNDQSAVFLGGKEVRAYYFGRGHTNGDAVIYFPAIRTIHTGDLMAGTTPLIDYPGGVSVVEWAKTLDAAMKLDFDTVIPGDGAVTSKASLLTYRNNVEKL